MNGTWLQLLTAGVGLLAGVGTLVPFLLAFRLAKSARKRVEQGKHEEALRLRQLRQSKRRKNAQHAQQREEFLEA
jgi:hypothetical protein